ncbi:MAG TPA: response regulator transcription factor [Mucilaginibacter sp.]|nr:response regulator transcription factor [Mucilaginibacter sp.]
MPRFLIADDHAIARVGLKEILQDAFPHAYIETVGNAEELIKRAFEDEWDIVISDIAMPGRSGLDALNQLHKEFPKLPVLIISVHTEDEYALRVIKSGGAGYLNKDDAVEDELEKAVTQILNGRKYITPSVAEMLAGEVAMDTEKLPHEKLSDREFDVFRLLAQGKSTGEIAGQLSLSVNTIGTFRSRLMTKMGIRNNAGLVAYAIAHGLV